MRAALVLALVLAASVAAEGGIRDDVDAALRRGDRPAALALLDEVRDEGRPADRARCVEAARAARELVSGPDGSLRAARILVETLRRDPSDREGAWTEAKAMRAQAVRREIDLVSAQHLFAGLEDIYRDVPDYGKDLALVYRDGGLTDEARGQYEKLIGKYPSMTDARYWLAALEEDTGRFEAAVAVYDELIALHALDPRPELQAHLNKGWLLLEKARDPERALRAAEAGVAAAQRMEPGFDRESYLTRFETLKRAIADDVAYREKLRTLRGHLDAVLLWTAVAWAAALGGGVMYLRRAKWI